MQRRAPDAVERRLHGAVLHFCVHLHQQSLCSQLQMHFWLEWKQLWINWVLQFQNRGWKCTSISTKYEWGVLKNLKWPWRTSCWTPHLGLLVNIIRPRLPHCSMPMFTPPRCGTPGILTKSWHPNCLTRISVIFRGRNYKKQQGCGNMRSCVNSCTIKAVQYDAAVPTAGLPPYWGQMSHSITTTWAYLRFVRVIR